jgi:hypothetical protein
MVRSPSNRISDPMTETKAVPDPKQEQSSHGNWIASSSNDNFSRVTLQNQNCDHPDHSLTMTN